MAFYKHVASAWKQPKKSYVADLNRKRMITWRRQPTVVRIDHPTRIDRARSLGYKAKQGFIVVRVKVNKSSFRKIRPRSGRRPKRMGIIGHTLRKSLQVVAEEKASTKYPNMEVLGSYWAGQDGQHKWFEIILVDPVHPAIQSDKDVGWIRVAPIQ